MQIAPSGIFLFRLLLNKALPLDVLFCFFGVFSLNLAPFGSVFIFSEIYLAEKNEDRAVPAEVGRYGGYPSKSGHDFVMGGCSATESASSAP
jgi:hypothetical protein